MLLPALLEGERQSGVIWYKNLRQSPYRALSNSERSLRVGTDRNVSGASTKNALSHTQRVRASIALYGKLRRLLRLEARPIEIAVRKVSSRRLQRVHRLPAIALPLVRFHPRLVRRFLSIVTPACLSFHPQSGARISLGLASLCFRSNRLEIENLFYVSARADEMIAAHLLRIVQHRKEPTQVVEPHVRIGRTA